MTYALPPHILDLSETKSCLQNGRPSSANRNPPGNKFPLSVGPFSAGGLHLYGRSPAPVAAGYGRPGRSTPGQWGGGRPAQRTSRLLRAMEHRWTTIIAAVSWTFDMLCLLAIFILNIPKSGERGLLSRLSLVPRTGETVGDRLTPEIENVKANIDKLTIDN